MSKFTKGKWAFSPEPVSLGTPKEDWYVVGSSERGIGFVRHKADARLIAAAPEMYELLSTLFKKESFEQMVQIYGRALELLARIDSTEDKDD